MGRPNSYGKFSRKKMTKGKGFPEVYFDRNADFAAIKLKPGIEAKSYIKDGIVFCEDARGSIIEIQILNVSGFRVRKSA